MLSLTVDHCYRSVNRLRLTPPSEAERGPFGIQRSQLPRHAGAILAVIVAAIAVVPPASVFPPRPVAITTQTVVLPTWFRDVAPHLNGKQVLLAFPTYFAGYESPSSWQAVDRMSYSMVNIGGPAGFVVRPGRGPSAAVIADTSRAGSLRKVDGADIEAVRNALDDWGVTMIVIPDQADLPRYDQTP